MIVRRHQNGFHVITQNDHAALAARTMTLWRDPALTEHRRRDRLLAAIRDHDNGWREADAAPRWDSRARRPHDFLSLESTDRIEIWSRGVARYAEQDPYKALLITEHARRIHSIEPPQDDALKSFVESLSTRRGELLEEAQVDEPTLERDYRWLALGDFVSLVLCNGWQEPFEKYGVRGHFENEELRLDPFGLAGTTTLTVPSRSLPLSTPCDSDLRLALAVADARWQRLSFRLMPL